MVLSGPSAPAGGTPQIPQSLLRPNSSIANQQQFNSLISSRTQFTTNGGNNLSMLANIPNVSSLLNHTLSNGVEPGQLFQNQQVNPLGNNPIPMIPQSQQMDAMQAMQSFQQQFSVQNQNLQPQLPQAQLRSVKLEPQMGPVKMEPQQTPQQQLQMQQVQMPQMQMPQVQMRPVKLERQQSESGMMVQISRHQNPTMQMGLMQQQQQQRMIQLQQQQQQAMKGRGQLPQVQLQQVQQQSGCVGVSGGGRGKAYEPGTCARRLTAYMYHQQHRPEDNNIEYWRKFVAEFFALNAKKRWCVSLYGSGRQTLGVFPQDLWHCEICNCKPDRGFAQISLKWELGYLELPIAAEGHT